MHIRAAGDGFLTALVRRPNSDSLLRVARRVVHRFGAHLKAEGVRDVRAVQERHVVAFARKLQKPSAVRGKPLATATQAAYLQQIKSFFLFLVRSGVILLDPAADIVIPGADTLPRRVLTEQQAEMLMNAPSASTAVGKRDRAILETLYGAGVRRAECVRLDVADIDLRNRTVLVRDGKGRRDRVVPLPQRSARAIDAYLRDARPLLVGGSAEPALFLTAWHGRRLGELALFQLVDRRAREAGLGHVHPHALRHTCATHLLRGGADLRHVQAILGHRWIKTTALYTRVDLRDLQKVIATSHPRERSRPDRQQGSAKRRRVPSRRRTRPIRIE